MPVAATGERPRRYAVARPTCCADNRLIYAACLEIGTIGWIVTIALIIGLLALDLILAAARPHTVGFKEAVGWSIFYIAVAIAFGLVFAAQTGREFGSQYFAGYIVEKSLSVDNLFVFVIIMTTFAVPEPHQHKVLTFGIIAALVMRAIFIVIGAALLKLFSFMFLIFGLLLIFTAIQLFRHRNEDPSVEDNGLVRLTRRVLPVTSEYVGGKLFGCVNGPSWRLHCSSRWWRSAAATCSSRSTRSRRSSG